MKKHDVIIVGGGLNGLAMALSLGGKTCRSPLRVALIDRVDPTQTKDTRASALTAATQRMLAGLGCWPALQPHAQAMQKITVFDGASPALLTFLIEAGQAPAVLIENRFTLAAFAEAIASSPMIEVIAPATAKAFHFGPGLAKVELETGEALQASLIIAADGRGSPTRQAAGIKLEGHAYGQSAITCSINHSLPHGGGALEKFHAKGVLALLPLKGDCSSLVWSGPHQEMSRFQAVDEVEFLGELQAASGADLGDMKLASSRQLYPLAMQLAESMIGPRLALVGDAAHVIHPLAGLGLNLGFKDAASLADCVMQAHLLGQDIGSASVLDSYVRWRRFDTVATAAMMDGLNRLFANEDAALGLLRQAGLKLVDALPQAKEFFMGEAAGTKGPLPRLMQGLSA